MKQIVILFGCLILTMSANAINSHKLAYMVVTMSYGSKVEIPIHENAYISFIESSRETGYNRLIRVVSDGTQYDVVKHQASDIDFHSISASVEDNMISDRWELVYDELIFDMESAKTVTIHSISGMRVMEKQIPQGRSSVSIASLPSGIYILTIGNESIKITKK